MKHIINENLEIKRIEVSYEEAEELFAQKDERLKIEILKDIPRGRISRCTSKENSLTCAADRIFLLQE